jgi:hypothetical protein
MAVLIQSTELASLMLEAHGLLEQFALDVNARPEAAWMPLLDLCRLLDRLGAAYPPKPFRQHHT